MSSKTDELAKSLARSLDAQKPAKPAKVKPEAAPGAAGPEENAKRVSLSLYGTDLDALDVLGDYLRKQGHRENNRSLLVKVAIRGLKLTPDLVRVLEAVKSEDKRKSAGE